MNHDIYSLEIQNYINQILESCNTDVELTLSYCRDLLAHIKEAGDDYLLGFAYYYMGEAYCFSDDFQNQMIYLFKALEHLKASENHELIAKAYNLLGILSSGQGNPCTALDYYLQGLTESSTYNLHFISGMIYSNIAILFTQVGNHKKAIKYLKNAVKSYLKLEPTQDLINNLTASYLSLGQSYLYLKKLKEALDCMKKVNGYLPKVPKDYIAISFGVFKAMLSHALGNFEERDACIQEILVLSTQDYSLLTFYDDFLAFSHFLLEIGKDSALLEMLQTLETMAVKAQNLHVQIELTKIKLAYYKKSNQDSLFLQTARQFYDLFTKSEAENKNIISSSIDLRFSLLELQKHQKKIEHENQKLVLKSESDALTGLPNRYKMNDYSETLLARALKNQVPFTVEILDIDYFKEYNDTYGHQAGDHCLITIAKELNAMMNEDVFCARYGGDEFIILYYNKSKDMVKALAEDLRQRICSLCLEHKNSRAAPFVTITQGLAFHIPKAGNRMWDFLYTADIALYEGKKLARNSITFKGFN